MSFVVDKHYCGETLVDISYFGESEKCCAGDMMMNENAQKIKKKKCCKNVAEVIESTTFDEEKIVSYSPDEIEFIVFHLYSYLNNFEEIHLEKEYYKDFSPPDLIQDIQVLYETYLI